MKYVKIVLTLLIVCGGILFSQPRIQKKYIYEQDEWRQEYPYHSIIDMKDTLEVHRFDREINSYSEHILTYNTDNLLTEELVRHFDGVWFDYERNLYAYSENLLTEMSKERKENFGWQTIQKNKYLYNDNEQLIKKELYLFNDAAGQLMLDTLYEFEYQDAVQVKKIKYAYTSQGYRLETKYVYDSDKHLKESVRTVKANIFAITHDRILYESDDSGEIISQVHQDWEGGWQNLSKTVFYRFADGRISQQVNYEWDNIWWKPTSRITEEKISEQKLIIISPLNGYPINTNKDFTFTWWGNKVTGIEIHINYGEEGVWKNLAANLPEKGLFTTALSGLYSENFTTIIKSAQSLEAKSVNILVREPSVFRENLILKTDTLSIPIRNDGVVGDFYQSEERLTFNDKDLLWSAGFYISGFFGNELYGSGMASYSLAELFLPGLAYQNYSFEAFQNQYLVKESDPHFGDSWKDWEIAAALGADFYDGNGDGIYQAIDQNNNGVWDLTEDSPLKNCSNISYSIYHDGNFSNWLYRFTDSREQGIEIHQSLFTMDSSFLYSENAFFINYEIHNKNKNAVTLEDAYFMIYSDTDIGYGDDDLFGTDTLRNAIYTYNEGADNDYGENPPALFMDCIQSSQADAMKMRASSHYLCGDPAYEDPQNAAELRLYATGYNYDGERMDPCNDYYGSVYNCDCENVNPVFAYSGNPIIDDGWIHTYACDLRLIASMGPFNLTPGEKVSFLIGYYAATGNGSEDAIVQTRKISDYYQEYFNPVITSIEENEQPGKEYTYSLGQNYPNPFNPSTTITFSIAEREEVSLEVFDILGRRVATLINRTLPAGEHEVKFNAENLCSGVYFYNVRAGEYINTRKMILLR